MTEGWEPELRVPTPLVEIDDPAFRDTRVFLKRDDLIHPDVPGNKWRKLKYLVRDARERGADTLLTFGGAYSNHVRAVAALGPRLGLRTVGVIRGEERPTNPGLRRAEDLGMTLHYLDRATYRRKTDADVLDDLRARFGDVYPVPEGGTTRFAFPGSPRWSRRSTAPTTPSSARWVPAGRWPASRRRCRPDGAWSASASCVARCRWTATSTGCTARCSAGRRATGRSTTVSTAGVSPVATPTSTARWPGSAPGTAGPRTGSTSARRCWG